MLNKFECFVDKYISVERLLKSVYFARLVTGITCVIIGILLILVAPYLVVHTCAHKVEQAFGIDHFECTDLISIMLVVTMLNIGLSGTSRVLECLGLWGMLGATICALKGITVDKNKV